MVQVISVMHHFGQQCTIDPFRQFDTLRIFGQAPRHWSHSAIQRRGEQQGLAIRRQTRSDQVDILNEPHIKHAVRFIENEGFDTRQVNATPLHVIEHTAGGCNDEL